MEFTTWSILGLVAACLTSFAYLPQVRKMWLTKSVRDVSLIALLQFIAGCALWFVYGVARKDPVIVLANATAMLVLVTGLILFLRYRVKDEAG